MDLFAKLSAYLKAPPAAAESPRSLEECAIRGVHLVPVSRAEVEARWDELVRGVRDPLLRNGQVRYRYSRGGDQYVFGGDDPLRLPHHEGKNIYALAEELCVPGCPWGRRSTVRVLDLGGGTGQGAAEIAAGIRAQCGVEAAAVVLDPVDIGRLADTPRHAPLVSGSMHRASACVAPHAFDFVISLNVLKHTPEVLTPLAEGCKLLRQGGVLLFSTVPRDYTIFAQDHLAMPNALDIVDCGGSPVGAAEAIRVLNRDNAGAYVFELSSLPPSERRSFDAVRYCEMVSVRCLEEREPSFRSFFYREGGVLGLGAGPLAGPLGRVLRRSMGFVLAENDVQREMLQSLGFEAVY